MNMPAQPIIMQEYLVNRMGSVWDIGAMKMEQCTGRFRFGPVTEMPIKVPACGFNLIFIREVLDRSDIYLK